MSQAVEKAARLLWWLAEQAENGDRPEQNLRDIAQGLALDKATTYRIAQSLAKHGLIAHDPVTRGYRIGSAAIRLARAATKAHPFLGQCLPILKELARETGETVSLSERRDLSSVTVHEIESDQVVRYANKVGEVAPLYLSAGPRAILTWSDESTRRAVLEGPIEPMTSRVISPSELAEAIAQGRRSGYCHSFGERHEGVHSLAVPVLGNEGYAVGAIAVLWPSRGAKEDGRRLQDWPALLVRIVGSLGVSGAGTASDVA
jgi:DNA-binding IclR family transcriptional regulator